MKATNTYITWLNSLGGFDYFLFHAKQEHGVEMSNSGTTKTNILPNWPKSYGSKANTLEKTTFREGSNYQTLKSQHLTLNQVEALKQLKISPIVQIVNSRHDRITVIVDTDSFKTYTEDEKVFSLSFRVRFTNQISAQRL